MIEKNKEGYKEDCGFRYILQGICSFKPENCNKEACDLFSIEWNKDSIKKRIQLERSEIRKIEKLRKKMKKDGSYKTDNKKKYKSLMRERTDKALGVTYLMNAYDYLCGGKYSALASRFPRLAKKFNVTAKDNDLEV